MARMSRVITSGIRHLDLTTKLSPVWGPDGGIAEGTWRSIRLKDSSPQQGSREKYFTSQVFKEHSILDRQGWWSLFMPSVACGHREVDWFQKGGCFSFPECCKCLSVDFLKELQDPYLGGETEMQTGTFPVKHKTKHSLSDPRICSWIDGIFASTLLFVSVMQLSPETVCNFGGWKLFQQHI